MTFHPVHDRVPFARIGEDAKCFMASSFPTPPEDEVARGEVVAVGRRASDRL
jgi:hypothetical protein